VIVGEAPASDTTDATDPRGDDRSTNVLALSARSDAALGALAGRLAGRLDGATDLMLGDVAPSANTGRSHLERRLAVLAGDRDGAVRQLRAFADGEPAADAAETYVTSPADAVAPGGLAFLSTGHGSHYAAMGSAL
jgi:epothilone polyketide synthase D